MFNTARQSGFGSHVDKTVIAIAVALVVGVTAWYGFKLTEGTNRIAAIWIPNGLLAGLLLTVPKRHWPWLLASGYFGNVVANLSLGDAWPIGLLLALCNSVEVAVGCSITRMGRDFDYLDWRFCLRFLGGCVIAGPLISTMLSSAVLAIGAGAVPLDVFKVWLPADAIGMATFAPLMLCVGTSDFGAMLTQKNALKTVIVLTIVVATSVGILFQSDHPFTFIIIGVLVLAGFQLGRAGLAISICIVAVAAVVATATHHGIFYYSYAAPHEKIAALQLFIVSAVLMTFPVAISVELTTKLRKTVEAANFELRQLSMTDALTTLPNRRAFDEALEREWRIAVRGRLSLSMLIIDVDHFKGYNDTYGHSTGDACLASAGQLLRDIVFRPSDLVARIGGEEFAVILPDTNSTGVKEVAERIREIVFKANMPSTASDFGRITVSIGAGTTMPNGRDTVKTLFDIADSYLYQAKQNGRNRVEAHEKKADVEFSRHMNGMALPKKIAMHGSAIML